MKYPTTQYYSGDMNVVRLCGTETRWQGHCCVTTIWHLPSQLCSWNRVLRLLVRECHSFRIVSLYGGSRVSSVLQIRSSIDHPLVSWMLSLAHLRYGTLAGHRRRRVLDYRLPRQTLTSPVFHVSRRSFVLVGHLDES